MNKFIITALAALTLTFGVSISHAQAACTLTGFSASPTTVTYGGSSTVRWSTSGCDTVSITPAQYPDNRPPSGSTGTGPLTQTTTFTAIGHTYSGSVSNALSVTITVTGNGGTTPTTSCKPLSFTAQEYTVQEGEGTVFHWDTQGCDHVAIHPADYPGDRPPYGSISTGAILHTTEYTLTAYYADGRIGGQRFLTINVGGSNNNGNSCQIDSFTADDTTLDEGDSTDLNWRTTGCDYVDIDSNDRDFNNLDTDDSVSVSPDSTTTYTLRAYDVNGNLGDTDTVRINVDEQNNDQCYIDSFSASPSNISQGNSSTLRWNTSGDVDYVTISNFSGNRSEDGSLSVSPYSTTSYTLRAYCNNGDSRTQSTTVYVNQVDQSSAPQAITTIANVLNGTQARLNGIAISHSSNGATAWFEWGVGGNYPNRTTAQRTANDIQSYPYSDLLSGLTPGVTYTYRAVVQNQYGTAYGAPASFRTSTPSPVPVVRNTVRNVVVAQSAASLLELRVESNYDRMCVNGLIDYTISYKNISSQTLENAVLQFTNPAEITYLTASRGNYDVVTRTMTIALGNVAPNEQGFITVHARINDTAVRGNLAVATASVVYTNSKTHAQEDATAYSLITVSNDCPNGLGASTFGFGSFLPNTLLGWLLLILVILALIVLARQFQKKPSA
jgi:hypothetical protein